MKLGWDAILFDLDGTLVDTTSDLRAALNKLCEDRGIDTVTQEDFLSYTGQGVNKILERFLGISQKDSEFKDIKNRFLSFYTDVDHGQSDFFPGIRGIIANIEGLVVPWGIVTGKWRSLTIPLLDHINLNCPCVVCGDDVLHPKPSPDSLLKAADILNSDPSKCIYIGDGLCDYEAASACNMEFLGVLWGYQRDVLLERAVSNLVSSAKELSDFLFK
ncbi:MULTISPECIES: HAD family hydrolase [Candidatus Ichthyocystis]|uniref:Putative phosphoglycolate phosphatase n=1 Tax=Candidatus Ichthyocystis hellenicum TaxID=1561003 RepID=A0A0S4M7G1_9BURK|nr:MULTISPECIES: HAD family hydrolase [Ichthyocystis]CUT18205.1 putative phosphoglycolate phosphatase [Candidatus Ichthyocystis hellenicum]